MIAWLGFSLLRKGRIHIFCPKCDRKISNAARGVFDPPRATLVHSLCIKCGAGGKEPEEVFFDENGEEISWEERERVINEVLKAEGLE